MKKIVSFMFVVAAVAMVSCIGRQAKTEEGAEVEAPATEVVEEAIVAPVVEEVAPVAAEGEVAVEEAAAKVVAE